MPTKPDLLYLSPVIPALTGNGLAMRAGMVLEALAEQASVSLLVVPLYPSFEVRVPTVFERLCRRSAVIHPTQFARPRIAFLPALFGRRRPYRESRFDIVHVFRLAMLPFARHFLDGSSGAPERHLDLDDVESATHRRLAALCRLNGEDARALFFESEARRYEALEDEALVEFDRVYVCSEGDQAKLPGERRGEICVIPNAVRVPDVALTEPGDGVFTFLFVGTLGYYPNEDAVGYLGSEIVPRLRQLTQSDFAVNIVGTGGSERCRQTATACGLRMIGEVPDVAPWYQNCGAVVTPIRAGGGTRVKILEAFSHRRSVVSTSIGVEGIDARDGEHLLIGDTPEAFAKHCVRLMTDRELRDHLVENAGSLLRRSYSAEAIKRTIAALFAPPAH